jgi:hypothetical protein
MRKLACNHPQVVSPRSITRKSLSPFQDKDGQALVIFRQQILHGAVAAGVP